VGSVFIAEAVVVALSVSVSGSSV